MANNDTTVEVKFSSDTSSLKTGLDDVSNKVNSSVTKMQSQFEGLNRTVSNLTKVFLAFQGIKIVAHVFEDIISSVQKFNTEVALASQILGINSTEASGLAVSLDDIGSSLDVYQQAYQKFVRQLNNKPDFIKSFGIDVTGTATQVFQRAVNVVSEYKAGIDQTKVAMDLFGRSVSDIANLQRLNNDVIEEGKKQAEEWGLIVTNKDIVANREWIKAQNDLKDILLAFQKVISGEILPTLTSLATSMGDSMPAALAALKIALAPILGFFDALIFSAKLLAEVLGATLATAISVVTNGFSALKNVFNGDFSAASTNIANAGKQIKSEWSLALDDMSKNTQNTFDKISNRFDSAKDAFSGAKAKSDAFNPISGTKTAPNKPGNDADNAQKKANKIALDLAMENSREEIKIGEDLIEKKKEILNTEVELGQKTRKEQLQQLQQFEDEQYNIENAALQKKLALADQDPDLNLAQRQKLLNDILDLQRKHEIDVLKLKNQTMLEEQKFNIEAQKSINQSFEDTVSGLISGQKTLKESLLDFVNSITQALSKLAAQNLAEQFGFGGGSGAGGLGGFFTSLFNNKGAAGSSSVFSGITSHLPSFDVGTNFVPNDMIAMIHKGEAIVPANQNTTRGNGMVTVNMTVNTPDANSFRQSQGQIAANLQQTLHTAGRRNN